MADHLREPAGPLVLVADDDPETRELVELVLADAGFRTVTAADGEEAIGLALARQPAVILLDLMMPGMDGYVAVTRLRRHPSTRQIPIIMLTGQEASIFREVSLGLGVAAYVTKPFSPTLLVEALRQVLVERTTEDGDQPGGAGAELGPEASASRALPGVGDAPSSEGVGVERWSASPQEVVRPSGDGAPRPPIETDPAGVAQAYTLLLASLREAATELHIEPLPEQVRIRHRVADRLTERARLPRSLLDPMLSRFRILAGLHDSRPDAQAYVRMQLDGQKLELELSFSATPHGDGVIVKLWRGGLAELDPILSAAVLTNASDIYLIEGTPPILKVDGVAAPLGDARPLTPPDLRKFLLQAVPEDQRTTFRATNEADLSFMHSEFGRFRLNCYRAMGATGMVLRRVKTEVPILETLGAPPLLGTLALERQGLILVVGATGSGKSTTLAAMIDHRNATTPGHIVTIEDPVEFIHPRKRSVISQREVGVDTESYLVALHKALRQAPDVILVGELRDRETVAVALHAAETGHLVLSTLHATNTTSAVERLLNFFPPDAREAVLMQVSLTLRGIIAQRLVPRAEGTGRVAAMEILLNTSRIQALIRRGELETIRQAIEEGVHEGLQTLDHALLVLYQAKSITADDALRFADSPQNLRLRIKGIR